MKPKKRPPIKRPATLSALAKMLSKDFGTPCVTHIKDLVFDCVVCRLTLALHILDDAYEVGSKKVQ